MTAWLLFLLLMVVVGAAIPATVWHLDRVDAAHRDRDWRREDLARRAGLRRDEVRRG